MRLLQPLLSELRAADRASLAKDAVAALVVLFMAIPQGVAYAVIAGLPPATGIYAATFPAIVGSLFRSSRHVIAGPTNALSLLVGGAILGLGTGLEPVQIAVTLALLVGAIQLAAGLLRLGAVIDYISGPVVLGYITGAGVLVGLGQLPNLTGTPAEAGHVLHRVGSWAAGLGALDPLTFALGVGTAVSLVVLRRLFPSSPGPMVVMIAGVVLSLAFDLSARGVTVVADLAPVPGTMPPLTVPSFNSVSSLFPIAFAAAVLSLVESTAVARAIGARTGDRLDASREFVGQGLANLTAAFCGGYPISGSLSRSTLNHRTGAVSRLSGVISGVLLLVSLVTLGPLLDATPVASLAGLLMVVAWDLIDVQRIRRAVRAGRGDALAFGVTLLGTWSLSLDHAIYLGVGISIVLFLRKVRLLVVRELVMGNNGRLQEAPLERAANPERSCASVRIVHIEGPLFFGAAGELQSALDEVAASPGLEVLILRMKRTQGLDATISEVLEATSKRLSEGGRTLILVGMRPPEMAVLERTGVAERLGRDRLFPTQAHWFQALDEAVALAKRLRRRHRCTQCPLDGR
jgi:SulP family sulfate permease